MKKYFLIILALSFVIIPNTFAGKFLVIDKVVENVNVGRTKGGTEMGRMTVYENTMVEGITFKLPITCVTFESTIMDDMLKISSGDKIRMVVSEGLYNGDKNYTIRSIVFPKVETE